MSRIFMILAMIVLLVASALGQPESAPAKLPTQDDIQKMIDAQACRPALRAIAQVMPVAAKGDAAYDKYSLLMMRGECLLQLKDSATASTAFTQALSAATSIQQTESARAIVTLMAKSPSLLYTPRTGDKTPLDLTKTDARKRAMAAMLADEIPAITAKVNEVVTAKSLPPILAVSPILRDFHALEVVGTGEDSQTTALVKPLADRIFQLIDTDLNRLDEQVKAVERAANRVVEYGGGSFQTINGKTVWTAAQGTSGLTAEHRQTLRDSIAYAGKINQACEDFTAVARRYERDGKRWQELSTRAVRLANLASAVYEHE